ncbi:MAG: sulfatase-like hydrolase/transferase, partial [bacterium]|nr:sulfatase-like hydrolase/transferase [bacterium]
TGGRKGFKASLFQGGIGVPFIARWPGKIPAGRVDDLSLISAVDLFPTFCELAGASLPEHYLPDGVSQVECLLGKTAPTRSKPLFWKIQAAWPISKTKPFHWVSYAVVQDQWKLLINSDASYWELYDIGADPYEQEDLKERAPKEAQRLLHAVEQWKLSLPEQPTGAVFSAKRNEIMPPQDEVSAVEGSVSK